MDFICYPNCSTCKKAEQFLKAKEIPYTLRNIKTDPPTSTELLAFQQKSGLPLKKFFNTSGLSYKALNLKEKLPTMTEEEQRALLATDGMLIKRPILVGENFVLVGFRETEWAEKIS